MDINDLFDGIMKSINQYADLSACLPARGAQAGDAQAGEITEQRLQEKACLRQAWRGRQVQQTGRGPENGGKNAENFGSKEKRDMTDLCPAGAVASLRDSPAARAPFARRARKP